jgi:hypothetical protein
MMKKRAFNQKLLLDQLGLCISKDNYDESIQKLNQLCVYNPFRTQQFVQVFINAWCAKMLSMLDDKLFDAVSLRIRLLYVLVIYNKTFNNLLTIYFDKVNNKVLSVLENYDRLIYLSMQSQYFYQKGMHEKAENSVKKCFEELTVFFKSKSQFDDGWLLVRKCLKNIKDKKKAKMLLEIILRKISE